MIAMITLYVYIESSAYSLRRAEIIRMRDNSPKCVNTKKLTLNIESY